MKHNWKFNKKDIVINRSGATCVIKDRWLDENSVTGEWYTTYDMGISGKGWRKLSKQEKMAHLNAIRRIKKLKTI